MGRFIFGLKKRLTKGGIYLDPYVSFILPSYNRATTLKTALENLSLREYSFPYEIIVVDNNSTDATVSHKRAFSMGAFILS